MQPPNALLEQGTYTLSLGELSTLTAPHAKSIAEGSPLFEAALRELGATLPAKEEALLTVARDGVWRIAEGMGNPRSIIDEFYRLLLDFRVDSDEESPECSDLRQWNFDYEVGIATGTSEPELDRQVMQSAQASLRSRRVDWIEPSWLGWNDGTVVKIARGIFDGQAFDRLPILHDALIDAGCDNQDILDHLREPGQHTTRCWVVDLILGD